MLIETDTQAQELHFSEMKNKATQNKYNLSVYPFSIIFGMLYACIDNQEFMSLFTDEPLVTVFVALYILLMFVYVWIKGNELNEIGNGLTNEFDSICQYISTFSRYEIPLKTGYFFFLWILLIFIKKNPEIIGLNTIVAIMLMILFSNQKIKDPMEWRKVDKIKMDVDQNN
jgi:hypothetical protein